MVDKVMKKMTRKELKEALYYATIEKRQLNTMIRDCRAKAIYDGKLIESYRIDNENMAKQLADNERLYADYKDELFKVAQRNRKLAVMINALFNTGDDLCSYLDEDNSPLTVDVEESISDWNALKAEWGKND